MELFIQRAWILGWESTIGIGGREHLGNQPMAAHLKFHGATIDIPHYVYSSCNRMGDLSTYQYTNSRHDT